MDNEQGIVAETEKVLEAEKQVKPVEGDDGKQPIIPAVAPEGGGGNDPEEGGGDNDPEGGGGDNPESGGDGDNGGEGGGTDPSPDAGGSEEGGGTTPGEGGGSSDPEGNGGEGGADANAEVVYHETSVETAYEAGCPECGCPPVVRTTMRETIVETVDENGNDGGEANAEAECGDDKDKRIAELEARVAELETIEAKYNALMAEAAEAENRRKCASAKAFAEKNGLDVNSEDVKNAIAELNFEKLAEMTMQEEAVAETVETAPTVKVAGYAEMDMAGNEYGGLLNRRSR